MRPIAVRASGMVSPVGLDAVSSCAAIRCGINPAAETRFVGPDGQFLLGCAVPLDPPRRGADRLTALAAGAIAECLAAAQPVKAPEIPVILCVAEPGRPGRIPDPDLLASIQDELKVRFSKESAILPEGRVALASALKRAESHLHDGRAPLCIVAGADTMLSGPTLGHLGRRHRLLTEENSDGFLPGEAGAAILLGLPRKKQGPELLVLGVGSAREDAGIDTDLPLRADGLVQAMRAALSDAGRSFDDVDYRIADVAGEQYHFKEAQIAIGRAVRKVKARFDLWHPADCLGEVGAAAGPCALAVALAAARKQYAPGPGVLCHVGNDDGARAAVVLRFEEAKA